MYSDIIAPLHLHSINGLYRCPRLLRFALSSGPLISTSNCTIHEYTSCVLSAFTSLEEVTKMINLLIEPFKSLSRILIYNIHL